MWVAATGNENRNATMWQEWPLPGDRRLVVMAPKEGKPTSLPIAVRGDYQTPGPIAPRRFLQVIAGEAHAPLATAQSGRLELARWIASTAAPISPYKYAARSASMSCIEPLVKPWRTRNDSSASAITSTMALPIASTS